MSAFNLVYTSADKALEAYQAQKQLVESNIELFSSMRCGEINAIWPAKDVNKIVDGNLKRLNDLARMYTMLRFKEINSNTGE